MEELRQIVPPPDDWETVARIFFSRKKAIEKKLDDEIEALGENKEKYKTEMETEIKDYLKDIQEKVEIARTTHKNQQLETIAKEIAGIEIKDGDRPLIRAFRAIAEPHVFELVLNNLVHTNLKLKKMEKKDGNDAVLDLADDQS